MGNLAASGNNFKSSPYQACQAMGFAEEIIWGSRKHPANVFQWDRVEMNLPGLANYDQRLLWVSKVREADGRIAADVVTYVDDVWPLGPSKKEGWQAALKMAQILSYLCLQDAPRKRRNSSKTPGAWAGGVVRSCDGEVSVLLPQGKWDKLKALIEELFKMLFSDSKRLNEKRLEQIQGFLIHAVQTYPTMKPYLIRLHMTIDGWRPNQDGEGWRFPDWRANTVLIKDGEEGGWNFMTTDLEAPLDIEAVPHLRQMWRPSAGCVKGMNPLSA
jgi:hypothetical protein